MKVNQTRDEKKAADGYRLYEGKYPSVSDVLGLVESGHLKKWIEDVGEEAAETIRRDATTLGTAVHEAANRLALAHGTDAEVPIPRGILPYAEGVERFLDTWVDEVLAVERPFVSHDYGFGGTFDLLARISPAKGGGVAVVDYKVAKSLNRGYNMQTAAYALLARENGYEVDRRLIVWIKKPPKHAAGDIFVRKCEGPKFENDERGFLGLLNYLYFRDNEFWRKLQGTA